jgi:hypothetical protein
MTFSFFVRIELDKKALPVWGFGLTGTVQSGKAQFPIAAAFLLAKEEG